MHFDLNNFHNYFGFCSFACGDGTTWEMSLIQMKSQGRGVHEICNKTRDLEQLKDWNRCMKGQNGK